MLLVWRVHSVLTANLDANLIRQGGTNIQRGQLKPRTLTLRTSHFPDLSAATNNRPHAGHLTQRGAV